MKLIVGLGNPGKLYENTRHNVGFQIIGEFARRHGAAPPQAKFESETVRLTLGDQQVMLLCPLTYMNLSGRSIRLAANFYKLPLGELLVICDDFNLPVGKLRFRTRGSSGGQQGLQNTIEQLGSEEFCRLRIGVGPLPERYSAVDFVLGKFTATQRETVAEVVDRACKAIDCWCIDGIDQSMNNFN
jgi:PTH1 family peptidyl-tRNA hydrolase